MNTWFICGEEQNRNIPRLKKESLRGGFFFFALFFYAIVEKDLISERDATVLVRSSGKLNKERLSDGEYT